MVLDPQNAALPVPTQRYIGGLALPEIRMLPYPHFPDLRGDNLNPDNPITASLGQLTLEWASPIQVDADKNKERQVIELLHSSENSWTSDSLNLVPDYRAHPDTGFAVSGERGHLLAIAIEGRSIRSTRARSLHWPKRRKAVVRHPTRVVRTRMVQIKRRKKRLSKTSPE